MAGSSGAVRAGRAFVELFTKNNLLYSGLDAAAKRLKSWGATIAKIGGGVGAAGGAVFAPLTKFAKDAVGYGADIKSIAGAFNLSTAAASGLAGAFEAAGVGGDEFRGVLDGLAGKVKAAADGNAELIDGLRGLRGQDLERLPVTDQLDLIADKIAGITAGPGTQYDVAKGLGLEKLLPYLKDGRAGLERLKEEGKDAVISPEQAERAAAAQKELNRMWMAGKYALLEIGHALLPSAADFKEVTESVREAAATFRGWVTENKAAIRIAAAVAAGMVAAGIAVVALGAVVSSVGAVLGAVVVVLKGMAAAVALVLSPAALLAAAVVGIGLAVTHLLTGWTAGGTWEAAKAGFADLAETATAAWGGIRDALAAGDIGLAARVALAGVSVEFARAVAFWTEKWNGFKGHFVDGWYAITDTATIAWQVFTTGITELFHKMVVGLIVMATHAAEGILEVFKHTGPVGKALAPLLDAAKGELRGVRANAIQDEQNREAEALAKARGKIDDVLLAGLAAEQQRKLDRANDLGDANRAIGEAQREFADALKDAAKAAKEKADADLVAAAALKAGEAVGAHVRGMFGLAKGGPGTFAESAKGTFALASGSQQFGYADSTARRALDAQLDIAKNAENLPAIKDAVKDVAENLKFR